MTPGQVTITCAACGTPRVVWRSWALARRTFCSAKCYDHFRKYMRPEGEGKRLSMPKDEAKKIRREKKMMRRHLYAHDLLVVVVNCSDRMGPEEIAMLMGANIQDVECMIRAFESTRRLHVNWTDLMIRRYLVAKHCVTKTDRSVASLIRRMYRNNTKVSECLSKPTMEEVRADRRAMNDPKYIMDDWGREKLEKPRPRRPWQTSIKFPVYAAA